MPISDLHRRLREAAVAYARVGWPILPVETPTADRLICGRCPPDATTAHDWWTDEPYGIACRTGEVFDALQMPARLGELVLPVLAQYGAPAVVEVPLTGNWLFLVTPGAPRITDLPADSGVRLRGRGWWILLPPTVVIGGTVAWVGSSGPGGRLPHSMTVQWAALRALVTMRREEAVTGQG
ncbi:MAG TPA: bifunctional DNA primase/polymerase [Pseudonocardiaceae bacterium]|nr:bifunctional DNA primase/polymerase [Pseudonocardiaceae bacterium]